MTDYYLKFNDEAQANEVLTTTEIDTVTNNFVNVSTLGLIYKPTGAIDTEGSPVMQAIEGWHVNVRTKKDAAEIEAYRVYPVTPTRVWG
jgi:hypothetical protein